MLAGAGDVYENLILSPEAGDSCQESQVICERESRGVREL